MSRFPREFGAVPLVVALLGFLALLMLAFTEGAWAWILLGVFTLLAGGAVAWTYANRHPHPAADDAAPGPAVPTDDGTFRILVVADADCRSEPLLEAISARAAGRPASAFVIAPALSSRVARWTGDESAYTEAQDHLTTTLRTLGSLGIEAEGRVGSHDPVQAADDGIREFGADLIVFTRNPSSGGNRLEQDFVGVARSRYGVPVVEVPAGPRG